MKRERLSLLVQCLRFECDSLRRVHGNSFDFSQQEARSTRSRSTPNGRPAQVAYQGHDLRHGGAAIFRNSAWVIPPYCTAVCLPVSKSENPILGALPITSTW